MTIRLTASLGTINGNDVVDFNNKNHRTNVAAMIKARLGL